MPIYNAAGFVAASINSILCQTWEDFELIVIDDGSEDGSLAVVQGLSDPRIRVESRPHRGVICALDDAFAIARGSVITRMDADDIAYPERLARLVEHAEQERLDVVGSAFRLIDGRGRLGPTVPVLLSDAQIKAVLKHHNSMLGTALVCRSALEKVGGFGDAPASEDYDLWARLASAGCTFGNVPDVLYLYRWHPDNTSQRAASIQLDAASEIKGRLRAEEDRRLGRPRDGVRAIRQHVRAYGRTGAGLAMQVVRADAHAATRHWQARHYADAASSIASAVLGVAAATPYRLVRRREVDDGRAIQPTAGVTVLLPVFNGGRYLRAAISSMLAQTYSEFELLVVNDGSTDGSGEIARSFSDSRVRVVDVKHGGLAAALNHGLRLAIGKYIVRMDADDLSQPDRLAIQLAPLLAGTAEVVGTAVRYIDAGGGPGLVPPIFTDPRHIRRAMYWMCAVCAAAFDKDAALAVGGYGSTRLTEDLDLWRRMAAAGYRFHNVDQVLYLYRRHADSVTVRYETEMAAETREGRDRQSPYRAEDAGTVADAFAATWHYWRAQGWPGIGLGRVLAECDAAQARWERAQGRPRAAIRPQLRASLGRLSTALAWRMAGRPTHPD